MALSSRARSEAERESRYLSCSSSWQAWQRRASAAGTRAADAALALSWWHASPSLKRSLAARRVSPLRWCLGSPTHHLPSCVPQIPRNKSTNQHFNKRCSWGATSPGIIHHGTDSSEMSRCAPVKRACERASSSGALKTVYRNRRGIAAEPPSVS